MAKASGTKGIVVKIKHGVNRSANLVLDVIFG